MTDESKMIFIVSFAALAFAFLTGFVVYHAARESFEIEAVEEGHAEFYIDKDHIKQWRWLEPVDKKDIK